MRIIYVFSESSLTADVVGNSNLGGSRLRGFLLSLSYIAAFAVNIGETLPSFAAQDMDGKAVDLKDSIGKKPIMLIFWASWCPYCKTEVPKVNEQVGKYAAKGMEFIGINDSETRARSFMDKTGMNYPVVFDKTGTLSQQYRVQGVPTIIIADKKGPVVFKYFGVPEVTDENFKQLNNDH